MNIRVTGGLRFKRCPDCEELHDVHDWPDNHARPEERLSAPNIISDNQPALRSMVDGKVYDSKRALRATYQPSGNREGKLYTEVGDDKSYTDPKPFKKPPPDRKAIKAAVGKAFSRAGLGA